MISGSKTRAEEVMETLKSWGAGDAEKFTYTKEHLYFFVRDGKMDWMHKDEPLLKYMNYEVVELSKPEPQNKPTPKLQPFQKVLVRDEAGEVWKCSIFSHEEGGDTEYPFYCVGSVWRYCIPYDGNESLLGRAVSPKGGEL